MSMRLTDVVVKWLEGEEWDERPDVDEENQTSSTSFGIQVSEDFSVKGYFDTNEKSCVIKLFLYFVDSKIPVSKSEEVLKWVNLVNIGLGIGQLAVIPDDRILRYYSSIDVEDASLEPSHISNLMGAGFHVMEFRLPQFMAICFGGKTAEEALQIEPEE